MDMHDAFLRDILAHPGDEGRRLVYADWLDEQGVAPNVARAELLRLEATLARLPVDDAGRPAAVARWAELRAAAGPEWLAGLAQVALDVLPCVLPPGARPRLLVLRGMKRGVEYPLYEGANFIGRADEKPVDIDLEDQEPRDRIWCSRQHACVSFENNILSIEDLNSANGTYVNRNRINPGQKKPLAPNDLIQIGAVQLRVVG
jgi:uncharacterized protein (TIGR02996 family)